MRTFTKKVLGGFGVLMLAAFIGACSFPMMSKLGEASQQGTRRIGGCS